MDAYCEKLNRSVLKVYDLVTRLETEMLRNTNLDLSIAELHILEAVGAAGPEGCSISTLAFDREVTLPTMTVAIKKLEKKGYVQKVRSEADGRMVRITLTRIGQRADKVHRYFHKHMVQAFAKDINDTHREALMEALDGLQVFLQSSLEKITRKAGEN